MTASLAPNTILQNRYQIMRLLGEGGMGAVYQAWDLRLQGHVVAVKENFDNTPAAQAQFQTEAAILARLSHPALTRVTDYFIEPSGRQYLVMDFVEGNDLDKYVAQYGRVPENQAVAWITAILDALEYLHTQRPPIIHRDIKPANIKIRSDGKVMLVDFGIAKVYDPTQKTQTGARAGTPGYAPLEQYGRGSTDARSDLYALGATLYFLLVGQPPPEATDIVSGFRRLTPPSSQGFSISPHVERAIMRAMALDANYRFQSVREFRDALNSKSTATNAPLPTNYYAPPKPAVSVPQVAPTAIPRSPSYSTLAWGTPNYAPFASRAVAYIIDSFISSLPLGIVYCLLGIVSAAAGGTSSSYGNSYSSGSSDALTVIYLIGMGVMCLTVLFIPFYFVRMTCATGQTIGKRMFKIKVVRMVDGKPPSLGYAILRFIGYILNGFTFYIGWLLPLFDMQKQALHDKLAGTIVIQV